MTTANVVAANVSLPLKSIHYAFEGALEGGSNYWLHSADLKEGFTKPDSKLVWWGHEEVLKHPFKIEVQFEDPQGDEGNNDGRKTLENVDLQRAVTLMAEKAPRHFADLAGGNPDRITYDVFMQMLVLGEIVYG